MNSIGKGIATVGLCAMGAVVAFVAPDHLPQAMPVVGFGTFFVWLLG